MKAKQPDGELDGAPVTAKYDAPGVTVKFVEIPHPSLLPMSDPRYLPWFCAGLAYISGPGIDWPGWITRETWPA